MSGSSRSSRSPGPEDPKDPKDRREVKAGIIRRKSDVVTGGSVIVAWLSRPDGL